MTENVEMTSQMISRKLSVAPMMDWTDRHDRYFLRMISKYSLLYTEMVTTGAVLQGRRERVLGYSDEEHPLAVQLGGSDAHDLSESARICQSLGYDEINLNVGCPSDRVQKGMIGACLMREPELVAQCVDSMIQSVQIPVTVKCRLGVDDDDSEAFLHRFIDHVKGAGCETFIIHARKALLSGLSPKQNRQIPPLDYERVYRVKEKYPELEIIINGGITDVSSAQDHLNYVDGVMIGREAYHNPFILTAMEAALFNSDVSKLSREQVIRLMLPYVKAHLQAGGKLQNIARHILGLFHGEQGGRLWRRHLSENAHKADADETVILDALQKVKGVSAF